MATTPEWDGTEVEVTVTGKMRYKVDALTYGSVGTLEEALAIDLHNAQQDPVGTLNAEVHSSDGNVEWSFEAKVV
jgi:hypothetical protein